MGNYKLNIFSDTSENLYLTLIDYDDHNYEADIVLSKAQAIEVYETLKRLYGEEDAN